MRSEIRAIGALRCTFLKGTVSLCHKIRTPTIFPRVGKEWVNLLLLKKLYKKNCKNGQKIPFILQIFLSESLVFCERKSDWAIHWKNEWFAHSIIYHELPERMAHICSFVLSNLSDSLTFAHLSWAIWANERNPSPEKNSKNTTKLK